MKRQEKGIRSTKTKLKEKLEEIDTQSCINPPIKNEMANQLYGLHAVLDHKEGTIFVDFTCTFPI